MYVDIKFSSATILRNLGHCRVSDDTLSARLLKSSLQVMSEALKLMVLSTSNIKNSLMEYNGFSTSNPLSAPWNRLVDRSIAAIGSLLKSLTDRWARPVRVLLSLWYGTSNLWLTLVL
ncbi:uncharacterized protein LOC120351319 [Nilaparvata lugens]|uniref:uncharacterized protein LOC120351319 n=1 Tax=Nilaparvata lugens TaxID=108931 RepID=UPI00193E06EF|nr:uncharacterized protein LOC120351319 [Nilaparvata lugens]